MPEADPACDHLRRDHRVIEDHLDILLDALLNLAPARIPTIEAAVREIRRLSAVHFEKEERIFYPKLRPMAADLLAALDLQHEEVRELERQVAGLLEEPVEDRGARWMNELRSFGIEFHDRIQHHIVDEEDHLFRLAGERLSRAEQESVAAAMELVGEG